MMNSIDDNNNNQIFNVVLHYQTDYLKVYLRESLLYHNQSDDGDNFDV